jgi:hypothetical protein
MSGSNGAGLTLRAALASTRYRRERAQRAAQESTTEGGEVERDDHGAGDEAARGEQPEGGGAEFAPTDHDGREEPDGSERAPGAGGPADGEHHV